MLGSREYRNDKLGVDEVGGNKKAPDSRTNRKYPALCLSRSCGLTLGVLWRFTGPFEAGFFPLFSAGVTRQQTLRPQNRLKAFVGTD